MCLRATMTRSLAPDSGIQRKRKIVRSRYVVFHEHEITADIDHSKKTTQYPTSVADVTQISIPSGDAIDREATLELDLRNAVGLVVNNIHDGDLDHEKKSPEVAINPLVRRSLRDH